MGVRAVAQANTDAGRAVAGDRARDGIIGVVAGDRAIGVVAGVVAGDDAGGPLCPIAKRSRNTWTMMS